MERIETESPKYPILVVEDEDAILRGLCDVLAFQGYAPTGASRGDLGLEMALADDADYALALLDVMLPGLNGFEVCEQLRAARPALPILMLTARGSEEDVLHGFRCGADDYVTKPFSVSELVARVAALLRRAGTSPTTDAANANRSTANASPRAEQLDRADFEFGPWRVEPSERLARCGERTIDLTARDLELMSFFARERGRILSRRRLLAEVWGYPDPDRIETRSVDMHIAKLRKKLDSQEERAAEAANGARPDALIETIRGEGYRFRG